MKPSHVKWIFAVTLHLVLMGFSATALAQEKSPDQTFAGLAMEGAALIADDPQARVLRKQQPDEAAMHGFDIGMGWAAHDRTTRSGRRQLQDALSPAERVGFDAAVAYSRGKSLPKSSGQERP